MVIAFSCPNGHRLTCPDDQAGRAAQCPQCDAAVHVPQRSPTSSASGSNDSDGGELPLDEIEFLCPNGHRVHAPAQLAGRAGQCPQCGTRFRVPTLEEIFEEDDTSLAEAVSSDVGDDGALDIPPDVAGEEDEENLEVPGDVDEHVSQPTESAMGAYRRPAEVHDLHDTELDELETHAACTLFMKLWERYSGETVIEVELTSGEKLVPARFAPDLSRKTHGLFTVTDADGSDTLTAVAWDSVVRISVRGVRQLPDGWFD